MIKAVRAIVHGHQNVDQAFDLYKNLAKESSEPKATEPAESIKKPETKTKETKNKSET